MKCDKTFFILVFALLLIERPLQAQMPEAARATNWLKLQKLQFKKAAASWSMSAAEVKELKKLKTSAPLDDCSVAGKANCLSTSLPVTGLLLVGQRTNADFVLLKWETLAEYNSKSFVLERQSASSVNVFDSIYSLPGAGTSYSKSKYQHTDLNNSPITSFYRVKQIDYDGHFTYSNIVQIEGSTANFAINVIPNPTKSSNLRLYFTIPANSQTIDYTIFNALGVPVLRKENVVMSTGFYSVTNNGLSSGYYFIKVHTAKGIYTKAFIIMD